MTQFAFIFPGQGSQKVGMGAELVQNFLVAREVFDEADASLGRAISQLCFEGPDTELKRNRKHTTSYFHMQYRHLESINT